MIRCSLLLFCTSFSLLLFAQKEANYITALANHLDARKEVNVYGGRADLVTTTHAIEVERAHKWKNSIGQALWYAQQLNLEAGIILIMEDKYDYKYVQMLQATLNYAGMGERVRLQVYPLDFPNVTVGDVMRSAETGLSVS
ncbi:MAG: hypothetical protein AB8G22_04190 [Saprospiraceae bacterium]